MFDIEVIKREIAETGYSTIPFPIKYNQFADAAEAYLNYLADTPQRLKIALNSLIAPPVDDNDRNGSRTEIGYRRKNAKEWEDNKEYFHFHPILPLMFNTGNNKNLENFFGQAQPIYDACANTLNELMNSLEKSYPGIGQKFFHENPLDNQFYLRFLRYEEAGKGKILAKGHYDRSGLTLALAESSPGLKIGKKGSQEEIIIHRENTALIMPGMLFGKVTNEADFPPSWHEVIRMGNRINYETSRWSIVFFADAPSVNSPTQRETHRYVS